MTEFRKMRRFKQELDHETCLEIIQRATSGVLSVSGDEGYPYGVPLSYVFVAADADDQPDKFYFHCAKTGHKIDAVRACDKVCFTIIDRDDVVADEFTTYFRSVICFGRAKILETPEEIMPAIRLLADRYSPDESEEKKEAEISREFPGLAMIELDVEHMTGKEAIELVRNRTKYE
ncbi:MAG: pyridoxamine 5'-phosphate oxidase family protein [Eubacterium sp.]|nr:pyridoxamine 5'-phosphate oxidase family protein [Eubacterium sp.]